MSTKNALEEVKVNNTINLTLNQNDLIELAIEEKLSILEPAIDSLEKEIEAKHIAMNEVFQDSIEKHIDKKLKTSKAYKDIQKVADLFKTKLVVVINYNRKYAQKVDNSNLIGIAKSIDFVQVQEYKDPISYAKKHVNEELIRVSDIDHIKIDITLYDNIDIKVSHSIKFDNETPKD